LSVTSHPFPESGFFFFQAEDGIRDRNVTGVQTCALPIYCRTVFKASWFKPKGAPRTILVHFTLPSSETTASKTTCPSNFAARAASEYGGGGQYRQTGNVASPGPAPYAAGAEAHLSLEAACAIGSNPLRVFVESGRGRVNSSIAAVFSLSQESNFN